MSQEPEAGVIGVDTEEWTLPEADGHASTADELAKPEASGEPTQPEVGDVLAQREAGDAPEPALSGPGPVADRAQRRHARPRDLRRLTTMALGVAVVVAVGFALYFWLQLGSARSEVGTAPVSGDISAQLAQLTAQLAETEQALRDAQVRVVDAETDARELREQLDATVARSAGADDELEDANSELAAAAERLRTVSESLAEAQGETAALASSVLGSVDPVDACVRAVAQLAENADQIGRGQLTRQARDAAATCAAAQDSLGPAVRHARGVLAD